MSGLDLREALSTVLLTHARTLARTAPVRGHLYPSVFAEVKDDVRILGGLGPP